MVVYVALNGLTDELQVLAVDGLPRDGVCSMQSDGHTGLSDIRPASVDLNGLLQRIARIIAVAALNRSRLSVGTHAKTE